MPLIVKDRVRENSVTSGTGTLTLTGSPQAFQTFSSAIGNGNTTYYSITETGTGNFEVGLGTVGAGTLTRDTVLESSNAGSFVNFGSAAKDVFCTYPAEKAILGNTSAVSSTGTGNVVLSDSPTFTGTLNAADLTTTGNTILGNASTDTLNVGNGGLVKDASGNLGVRVVPSAWQSSIVALQLSTKAALWQTGGGATSISNNIYRNSSAQDIYLTTAATSSYAQNSGIHSWLISPSGTAGNPATQTTAMTLHNSGGLSLGNTTDSGAGSLNVSGNLQLTGSDTVNQNIATTQTTGTLSIGGTGATGAITVGQSTGAQTVNIATGTTSASTTKAINIGTAGNATSTTNITIGNNTAGGGTLTFGQATGTQTTNIQAGATASGLTKTMSVGTGGLAGSTTNIAIGSTAGTSTTTLNGAVTLSATTQAINIGNSQSSGAINIGTANNRTGAINIGTGAGGLSAGNITIGDSTSQQTITLGRSTDTHTVNIATGATASGSDKNVNIGTNSPLANTNIIIGTNSNFSNTTLNGQTYAIGSVFFSNSLKQTPVAVSALPSDAEAGDRNFVTDALAPTFGATVANGGAVGVPVYHDGTSWKVG